MSLIRVGYVFKFSQKYEAALSAETNEGLEILFEKLQGSHEKYVWICFFLPKKK